MNLSYLIAGLVFLYNPNINIIDIMPDAIGYLLILYGLKKLADFYPMMAEARKIFKTLLLISVLKILVAVITYTVITDKGYLLVFSFVFGLFEAIYTFSAFSKLFDSLLYFGTRYEGTAVFKNAGETKSITLIFMIARAVSPFLPELTFLSTSSVDDGFVTWEATVDLGEYKSLFTVAAVALTLLLSVIWLIMVLRYFLAIQKDTRFLRNLEAYYNEVIAPDTDLFTRRRLTFCLAILTFGSLFLFDLYADGLNFIPSAILPLIWCAALLLFKKYDRTAYLPLLPALGFAGADIALWFAIKPLSDRYYGSYTIRFTGKDAEQFSFACTLAAVGAVLFFVTVIFLAKVLLEVIDRHTGMVSIREDDALTAEKNRSTKKQLRGRLYLFCTASALAAVSYALQVSMLYQNNIYIMIHVAVVLVWFLTAYALFSKLSEQVLTRYFG